MVLGPAMQGEHREGGPLRAFFEWNRLVCADHLHPLRQLHAVGDIADAVAVGDQNGAVFRDAGSPEKPEIH